MGVIHPRGSGVQLQTSGLKETKERISVEQNTCHGNSDREAGDLRGLVCGYGTENTRTNAT